MYDGFILYHPKIIITNLCLVEMSSFFLSLIFVTVLYIGCSGILILSLIIY